MSFGSFLSGIYHQIVPSFLGDRQTYGSVNPPQKKRRDDQSQFGSSFSSAPAFNQSNNNQPQIRTQRPQNLFASLNNDLQLPGAPKNALSLNQNTDLSPLLKPQPGSVVTPTNQDQQQRQKLGIPSYVTKLYHDNNGNITGYEDNRKMQDVQVVPNKPQEPPQSNWHKLTHNPVTNVVGGVGKAVASPFVQFGKAAYYTPQAVYREVQNKPIYDIQKKAFGTTDQGKIAEKIIGSTAGVGLTVAAPGASSALEGTAARFLPEAAPSVIRTVVPKAFAGANIGGAFNTAASVQNNEVRPADLAKSYATGAIVGGGLEGASPYLTRLLPNFLRRNKALTADTTSESPILADNVLSEAQLQELTQPPTQISVNSASNAPVNIPVRTAASSADNPFIHPLIRENGGDAIHPSTMPTPQEIAQRNFNNQPVARPDMSIEGVTPRTPAQPFKIDPASVTAVREGVVDQYANLLKSVGEGNGTQLVPDGQGGYIRTSNNYRSPGVGSGRMTKQDWLDEARRQLDSGKAEPGLQQVYNEASNPEVQSMLAKGEQKPAPVGSPIAVKQVKGIPVIDQTVVPTEAAGKPGTVRSITQNSPMAAKTEAATNAPVVSSPAPLPIPAETQAILDNPKQFTKRQVAAARNQLKLAKQMAKVKGNTQDVLNNMPELAPKPEGNPNFVPTGNFNKGVQGNVTESASKASEAAQAAYDTSNLSIKDVISQAQNEIADNGAVSPQSVRNLKAMRDSGKFAKSSPEYKALNTEYNNAISHYARGLSLTDRAARANATGDQLANRFVNKLLVFADSNKLTEEQIARVGAAENAFTDARDAATALAERFKATGNQEDFNAWLKAQKSVEQLDRQAKITEFHVSKEVLGKNKNLDAVKALQDAEKNAGVYSMDAIDANMLSGTGTMVRNFVNTLFPRTENKLFGKVSSLAVRKLAPIGGSSSRGAKIGAEIGSDMFKADMAARKEGGIGVVRRIVTAGNTVGERNIQATAYSKGFDHYKQLLSKDGYSGAELNNRAEFMARTDPQGLVKDYEAQALQANALSSLTHTKKIENVLADKVQKWLADSGFGHTGQQAGRLTAKGITRVGLGFPTVIARSLVEGMKRATVGFPEAGWSALKFAKTGDREAFAQDLSKAIQHAGSGASLILLGHALGKAGLISGPYPKDKAERERWTAEGRQPDSIKIGGQWFNIPGYLGGFALPMMLGASTATGSIKDEASLGNAWQTILDASPVDNIQSTVDILTGNASDSKIKNAATSLVRTATPAGSFLAELAKLTDSTKNDTSTKSAVMNILDNIAGGIPGLNNAVNKTPATDAYGNEIHNPNPVATALGAQGAEQKQGQQSVNQDQSGANKTYTELRQYGVLDNKSLMQLVDPKLAAQIQRGEDLTPEQVASVQKSVTKGVSASGDNNWRESGDYATDRAALQTKVQLLQADPTTKPSEIAAYKAQILRDNILEQNKVPYDALKQYEDTTLTEWRDMGDPQSDAYDPEAYQKLWSLDQLMAKAGVSYKRGDMTKQKYSAKKSGSGRGGSRKMGTDFGTLQGNSFIPSVKQYQTIDTQTGSIPVIGVVRPNIVHKISSSG